MNYKKYIFLIIIIGNLLSCSTTGIGVTSTDNHTSLKFALENKMSHLKVTVIKLGDQIKLIIPARLLFRDMTDHLITSSDTILAVVLNYLNCYAILALQVAAYTDDVGPRAINKELSLMQAQIIARYLQNNGLSARLITALGYGPEHLVTAPATPINSDQTQNYRIEIVAHVLSAK